MGKFVFVTGGVVSALGKGITAASLGMLLQQSGRTVAMIKADPYLNANPGTMSPTEHGEVWVTDDGAETDLDLGHYERFLGPPAAGRTASVSAGHVLWDVLSAEREGRFLGKTVQLVPHVTDALKGHLTQFADQVDVTIVEIGGTVGDMESLPFLEAIRQLRREVGGANVCYVHVSLVPHIAAAGELKTKPTQHAVATLRAHGIVPDVLVCRADRPLPDSAVTKIGRMCDVPDDAVISAIDDDNIYRVPLNLHADGLLDAVTGRLQMPDATPGLDGWAAAVDAMEAYAPVVRVGVVGKYTGLDDSYLSVLEALRHAGVAADVAVDPCLVDAEDLEHGPVDPRLAGFDALVVPGGFGDRGGDGKLAAIRFAREQHVPLLGICLGMQLMVVDHARHVLGWEDAHSTEFDPQADPAVVDLLPDQHEVVQLSGTMRLGGFDARLRADSRVADLYGGTVARERHRHRLEVSPQLVDGLARDGLVVAGTGPAGLVEFVERSDHPFMVGTQAHPEFTSTLTSPNPLFVGLVRAAV